MCLSDTAEYWWREPKMPYCGKEFRHNKFHECSHYNPNSGNTKTTDYIEDINCYECIKNIENGIADKSKLKEGAAPPDYYMSKRERKLFRVKKLFIDQHGYCECGGHWKVRKNKSTGQEFLGCKNYPDCKKTKPIK